MVHELRALHSVCWVGGLVRIVPEGSACGSRGGHLCVVDIKKPKCTRSKKMLEELLRIPRTKTATTPVEESTVARQEDRG